MLLAGLTLLPALLAIFGRAAFWPSKTREGTGKIGMWGRVATRIVQHPGGDPHRRPGRLRRRWPWPRSDTRERVSAARRTRRRTAIPRPAQTLLTKYFPSSTANPTNIIFKLKQPAWDDGAAIQSAGHQLSGSGLFTKIAGPLDPTGYALTPAQYAALHARLGPAKRLPPVPPPGLKIPAAGYQLYRATAQYVSPDGRTVQFATGLKAGDAASTSALDAVPSIRDETTRVARNIGAIDSGVGGEAPALYDVSAISDSDLSRVIPVAILVIGVLLALVMRSLVAPLYLIASVGLSYLAALGLAVLLFIDIGGSAGLTFILPFLMFIFLLALGEDYNILVMTRIREEARSLRLRDAVSRALAATGTTVTSAGLVLAGTFGVFALVGARTSGGGQFTNLAVGLALGILMDTFLVRTLLVPSTVLLLGRWNWWPSRMGAAADAGPAGEPREPEPAEVS